MQLSTASFSGELQDFYDFIGPKIRNDIATMTKKRKTELGYICQICNQKNELDAAHRHGRERNTIIKNLLEPCKDENGLYTVLDIRGFIRTLLQVHIPIEENFLFLCKSCHREYDNKENSSRKINNQIVSREANIQETARIHPSWNEINSIKENKMPNEILCKIETNSWKYKLGWTSIRNRKNIEELISKIESNFDCTSLAFKSWYFHKRRDNHKQFSGIICHKNRSLLCFRINPEQFDLDDDRIILIPGRVYSCSFLNIRFS